MPAFDDAGLYTTAEMRKADRGAIEAGIPGIDLMEKAGAAVASVIVQHFEASKTLVLCGPGNNGGDGFVLARHLEEAGWPVSIMTLGDPSHLQGDAAIARDRWGGCTSKLDAAALEGFGLVVDALFGAGLTRSITGQLQHVIERLNALDRPIIAVDIASGIDGDTGEVRGAAIKAEMTVTFHRPKPGHYLLPGRAHTGRLMVADIGIPESVDQALTIDSFANLPALWRSSYPKRDAFGHKYSHGHALVLGGGMASSGAARLGARAALRAGAGLVTALCPAVALPVYAATLTAIMVQPLKNQDRLSKAPWMIQDEMRSCLDQGPVSVSLFERWCWRAWPRTRHAFSMLMLSPALPITPDVLFKAIQTWWQAVSSPRMRVSFLVCSTSRVTSLPVPVFAASHQWCHRLVEGGRYGRGGTGRQSIDPDRCAAVIGNGGIGRCVGGYRSRAARSIHAHL